MADESSYSINMRISLSFNRAFLSMDNMVDGLLGGGWKREAVAGFEKRIEALSWMFVDQHDILPTPHPISTLQTSE